MPSSIKSLASGHAGHGHTAVLRLCRRNLSQASAYTMPGPMSSAAVAVLFLVHAYENLHYVSLTFGNSKYSRTTSRAQGNKLMWARFLTKLSASSGTQYAVTASPTSLKYETSKSLPGVELPEALPLKRFFEPRLAAHAPHLRVHSYLRSVASEGFLTSRPRLPRFWASDS